MQLACCPTPMTGGGRLTKEACAAAGAAARLPKTDAVRVDQTRRPYGQKTAAKRRRSRTGRQSALIAFPSPDAGFVVFLIAAATAGTQHSASASSSSSFSNAYCIVALQHQLLCCCCLLRFKLQTAASVDKAKMNKTEMNLSTTTTTAACTCIQHTRRFSNTVEPSCIIIIH
ncbi:conserved hypothetical protein [Trichinella spiralis]|uniref:hypothetical protein n=1 Tax=Trichinella spiralis TaxID=6334 RepID=UPI0001EFC71C|nr:conserved hypothetical protein [Trichinella spiralis]